MPPICEFVICIKWFLTLCLCSDFLVSRSNPIDDGIVVTVGRYANESNECDESPVYSTSSENPKQLSPYTLHDVYSAKFADLYKVTIGNPRDSERTPTPGGQGEFEVIGDSDEQNEQIDFQCSQHTEPGQEDDDMKEGA